MVFSILSRQKAEFYGTFLAMVVIFAALFAMIDWKEKADDNNRTKYFQYGSMKRDSVVEKLSNYLYLSVTTLTTLGLGDIYPVHPVSQMVMAVQTIVTFAMISSVIS
jgi:hypothetical protein